MISGNDSLEGMKIQIKEWEHSFFKEHNKKPLKDDIRKAPDNIKALYKKYWNFKSGKPDVPDQEKNSAWGSQFNKVNHVAAYESTNNQDILRRYCEKLKKQTNKDAPLQPLKEHSKVTKPLGTYTERNIFKIEELKIVNVMNTKPLVKQINVLSPSINNRPLYFQSNINKEWLERCEATKPVVKDEVSCELPLQSLNVSKTFPSNDDSPENSGIVSTVCDTSSNSPIVNKGRNSLPTVENAFLKQHSNNKCTEAILPPLHNENTEASMSNDLQENGSIAMVEAGLSKSEVNYERVHQQTKANSRKRFRSPTVSSHNNDPPLDPPVLDLISKKTLKSEDKLKKYKPSQDSDSDVNLKKAAHLTRKITSGTLNENFVRVNIKKKHFSRGHHKVNVKKMKWQKWKKMKKDARSTSSGSVPNNTNCFKCGETGHWAYKCPSNKKTYSSKPDSDDEAFEVPLPTLEEAEALYKGSPLASKSKVVTQEVKLYRTEEQLLAAKNTSFDVNPSDDTDISKCSAKSTECSVKTEILPLFSEEQLTDIPEEVYDGLKQLGYSKFREGQAKAIMRVLCGFPTVVILPTGAGKSLCYQLPAYLYAQKYKCITLVISPLVSLMEDQMRNVSSHLHVVALHSAMTPEERKKAAASISDGTAHILLVSPETIIGRKGFLPADLPPIAFACIDEVHCLSEWSHNFRPSYLQLYKVLIENYGVGCVLGLTATATKATTEDLTRHLDLKIDSIIGNTTTVPCNLHLSVSQDIDKDWALIKLLKGDRFKCCSSIIIYCIRREETERISALIRTCMQSEEMEGKVKSQKRQKRNLVWTAEAYHAGLMASKRRSIQKKFMSGKLHVIVATIAFGMGLNKSDVRAVIHYNMPKSFESYVQEIGRAGRDGLDSHCHLFLHPENQDLYELRRHVHSNGIDRIAIKKLLRKVFIPCECPKIQPNLDLNIVKENSATKENLSLQKACPKHELVFAIDNTIEELDLKEENISTLLCYLELHPEHWIEQLSPTYATCLIRCYGGPNQLRQLAQKYPIVAMALAHGKQSGKEWDGGSSYEFQIIDLASHMNLESGQLKREFKALEWNNQNRKSGVLVEFSTLSFHLRAPGNLTDDRLDFILDFLFQRVNTQEKSELEKLEKLNSVFKSFSHLHYWSCCDEVDEMKSNAIKEEIRNHFEKDRLLDFTETTVDDNINAVSTNSLQQNNVESIPIEQVKADIQDIINTNHDRTFTARAIARIFHGIGSPCYPAEVWGSVRKFWRCHLNIDFHIILKMASDVLRKGY